MSCHQEILPFKMTTCLLGRISMRRRPFSLSRMWKTRLNLIFHFLKKYFSCILLFLRSIMCWVITHHKPKTAGFPLKVRDFPLGPLSLVQCSHWSYLFLQISQETFSYLPDYCSGYKGVLNLGGLQKAEIGKTRKLFLKKNLTDKYASRQSQGRVKRKNSTFKVEWKSKGWKVETQLLTGKRPEFDNFDYKFYQRISFPILGNRSLIFLMHNTPTNFKFSKHL